MSIIPQFIINSLIAAGTYALVALGFNLIYATTKFFNLAHGVVAAIGGYAVFFLVTTFSSMNILFAAGIGICAAAIIGWGIDRVVYRTLRARKASNLVLLVASLGVFTLIQAALAMIFSSQFKMITSDANNTVYQLFGASISEIQVIIIISALIVMALLMVLLKTTMFGKAVRAVSDDEEVAKIVGINTEKIMGWVFFIGSGIAGLAGVLVGLDTGLQPTMGLNLLLKGVIAAIVGGIGSVYGAVLGALLLGFVENFGVLKISGEWKDSIAFALLILFLIFKPKGLVRK